MPETVPDAAFESAKRQFLQGLDHFEAGRFQDAEPLFRGSLLLLPGRVSTLVNLAATLLALRRAGEALATAEEVLAQEADNPDAEFHRATALGQLERPEESLAAFERVLRLNDQWAEAWSRHGQTLQALARHAEALASYRRAVALDERLTLAWVNLGSLLREGGQPQEAAAAFRQAIRHGADTELVRYYLASVGTGGGDTVAVPAASPRLYVQSLFDSYAEGFDTHLVQVLGYKTHEILVQHLRALAPGRRFEDALDLGCGTGLCGRLVRPFAVRLAGVDLSQAMLDKAAAYDALAQGDIVEHLQAAPPARHDLVLATDVFIYLGDLDPTFAAVHRTMRPGGLFCFSAELLGDTPAGGPGFALRPSLRYAHGEAYLRGLAERHGFDVERVVREPLREEQRLAIQGLFAYLRRR